MCVPSALFVRGPADYSKAPMGHTHRWVNKAIVYFFVSCYVGRDRMVLIFLSQGQEQRRLVVNFPQNVMSSQVHIRKLTCRVLFLLHALLSLSLSHKCHFLSVCLPEVYKWGHCGLLSLPYFRLGSIMAWAWGGSLHAQRYAHRHNTAEVIAFQPQGLDFCHHSLTNHPMTHIQKKAQSPSMSGA